MNIFVISSSSSNWWDCLNDVIVVADSKETALSMVEHKFEDWQKPLTVEKFDPNISQIIFENFDIG